MVWNEEGMGDKVDQASGIFVHCFTQISVLSSVWRGYETLDAWENETEEPVVSVLHEALL